VVNRGKKFKYKRVETVKKRKVERNMKNLGKFIRNIEKMGEMIARWGVWEGKYYSCSWV
jgi:hypothetical protein